MKQLMLSTNCVKGCSMNNLSRNKIAMEITVDLLNNDVLDENNFSYDTAAVLNFVQNIILEHLKNFSLLSGTIF